jgi:hypothetical protein
MTRRDVLALTAAGAPLFAQSARWLPDVLRRHDTHVAALLKRQITDPSSRWRGIYKDDLGLYYPSSAAGVIDAFLSAYLHPSSRFYKDNALIERVRLAAELLSREQSDDGNINLIITNFNSPPDTGFVVRGICPSVSVARRAGLREVVGYVEPFLKKAGAGMAKGGVHTPNHRWVICAALAQLHELFSRSEYLKRIDQWLAEGIDIDPDGQYSERSTFVYNPVTNHAFVTLAAKLKRPELLDPVRRNLESMMYLLHDGYGVVTEISHRQDQFQNGHMGPYWFSLAHMARHDKNGAYETLANHFAPTHASLSSLLEYPELTQPGPAPAAVPDNYRRAFPHNRFTRIRRGKLSATILGDNRSRFLTFRYGDAQLTAMRFASAFFGKAQFIASGFGENAGGSLVATQQLEGPYYQPLDPPQKVGPDEWAATRPHRRQTEIGRLTQMATVTEIHAGFRVRVQSFGTRDVPVAIELSFGEGGRLEGVVPAPQVADAWLLESGTCTYRAGSDVIRFGPSLRAHGYTQIRGGEPKLPGPTAYLTGFTPVDHTIEFVCGES